MKKILIEIGHPAHVHQFKNMYWELEKNGWQGLFVTKDKECAIDLLKAYKLPYKVLGLTRSGIVSKIISLPYFATKMFKVATSFKPDVFVSRVSPLSGWSSFLLRKPHITFTDTENVRLMDFFSEPFADVVLTSDSYLRNHGRKHIRYPGYHELAYLHPNRFTPNSSVMSKLGLLEDERYAIIRFVAWNAHHDIGQSGISNDNRIRLTEILSSQMKVYITSEADLPYELKKYQINIAPEEMHSVLSFAQIYVGESPTMAEECAVLGVPSILVSSWAGETGVIKDLEKYNLVRCFHPSDIDSMYSLLAQYLHDPGIKTSHLRLKNQMLNHRIDVSEFMAWFINDYPNSLRKGSVSKVGVNWIHPYEEKG